VHQLLTNLPGITQADGAGGAQLMMSAVVLIVVVPLASVAAAIVIVRLVRQAIEVQGSRGLLRGAPSPNGQHPQLLRAGAAAAAVVLAVSGVGYLGATVGAGEYAAAIAREWQGGADLGDYYVAPKLASISGVESGGGVEFDDEGRGGAGGGSDEGGRGEGSGEGSGEGTSDEGGLGEGRGEGGRLGMSASGPAEAAAPREPRNLVLIYLESIEEPMGDEELFELNMLEPVERATAGWATIEGLEQYAGGGWTMAGLVATQCGIPLRSSDAVVDIGEMNAIQGVGDAYMPGAVCLGDVLAEEGYRNVYLGGADARFAGKGDYLVTHGYDAVKDLSTWRALGETETRSDWGLSDRRLFERAKQEVAGLHAAGQPFNLTVLSLDTHESPYLYEHCDAQTEVVMTSITRCSMEQVAGFIHFMRAEGMLDDTAVVVMGDHRKMLAEGGSFWEELSGLEHRPLFNRVWSPDGYAIERRGIDQLSVYPTLLELVGFELADHRAGVGVSALVSREEVPPGTVLDLEASEYAAVVSSLSAEFYRDLWGSTSRPPQ